MWRPAGYSPPAQKKLLTHVLCEKMIFEEHFSLWVYTHETRPRREAARSRCIRLHGLNWEQICCVRCVSEKHFWLACSPDMGLGEKVVKNSSLRDIIIASSEWIAPRKTFLLCCANHNCSMITQCFTCLSFKLQSYLLLRTLCCGSIMQREQKTEVFQATTEVVSWTLHSKHLQGYSCHKNVFIFRHLQPASHTGTNK